MDVREKLVELPIEDALLVLREEHRQRTDSYTTYLAHGGKGDPAEEVGLDALAMAISALEKTKWISVDDRLPDVGIRVIACGEKGGVFVVKPEGITTGFGRMDGASKYRSFTHWMPLPEPPKEGAD